MSNHTQGPWEYKRTSGFDYGSVEYWLPGICTNVKTEANARLIAAAPELLEALKAFMDTWNSGDATRSSKRAQQKRARMWTLANATIAKVEAGYHA